MQLYLHHLVNLNSTVLGALGVHSGAGFLKLAGTQPTESFFKGLLLVSFCLLLPLLPQFCLSDLRFKTQFIP